MTSTTASAATAELVNGAFVSFEATRRRNFQALEKNLGQHTAWLGRSLEIFQKLHFAVEAEASLTDRLTEKENDNPKAKEKTVEPSQNGGAANMESSELDQLSSYLQSIPYLRCVDMRDKLKSMGLAAGGNKKDLQKRLKVAIQAEISAAMKTNKTVGTTNEAVAGSNVEAPLPSSSQTAEKDGAPGPNIPAPSLDQREQRSHDTRNADESIVVPQKDESRSPPSTKPAEPANQAPKSDVKTLAPHPTDAAIEELESRRIKPESKVAKSEAPAYSKKTTSFSKGLLETRTFFSPPRKKERGEEPRSMEVESTVTGEVAKEQGDTSTTSEVDTKTQTSAEQRKAKLDEIRGKSKTVSPPVVAFQGIGASLAATPSDRAEAAPSNQRQDEARVAKNEMLSAPKTAPNKKEVKLNIQDQLPYRSVFKAPPIPPKDKEERKKILAAQMREKAAAEARGKRAGPAAPSQSKHSTAKDVLQLPSGHKSPQVVAPDVKASEKALSPMDTYEISDREGSSDDDSDDDDADLKHIPEWARKPNLESALLRQFSNGPGRRDPDEIFPEFHTCNLKDVFGVKSKGWYDKRKSSGDWTGDRITSSEKKKYKETMGFN